MIVGVIGAGIMGSGIAQAFAMTEGYEVCLCDINHEFADNGKAKIERKIFVSCKEGKSQMIKVMRFQVRSKQVLKTFVQIVI